jgi:DNA repair exonuclease SbcCD ATPase subunit
MLGFRTSLVRGRPTAAFVRVASRPSVARLASEAAKAPIEQGDLVKFTLQGSVANGVVQEKGKAGWFTIALPSNELVKLRSTQLQRIGGDAETPALLVSEVLQTIESVDVSVPPPTIYDLDAAMSAVDPVRNKQDRLYLEQCRHHASYTKWVMFTDLHCATSSIDTCLQVLDTVHRLAIERGAGVLFLGDWWHHRGSLRVDLLNSVLEGLRSWKVPMVMIPGNHDQVTLGGHNHGLTPLENAYRVERQDDNGITHSFPGPLVFSYPTKFAGGFFVPHVRDHTVMESILKAPEADSAVALFVHADVTGAYMNDLIVSMGGVAPHLFPANKPIYSGHFHKPHRVMSRNVVIDYVGSPYETSLSELRQIKALWVLDSANGWVCTEKIPLDIGRKHYKTDTLGQLLELVPIDREGVVKAGDRVVVTIGKEELEEIRRSATDGELSSFDRHVKELRRVGATVEVREIKSVALEAMQSEDKAQLEEMTPEATLTSFLTEEVRREAMTNITAEDLLRAGMALMEELETSEDAVSIGERAANFTNLVLEEVTIQGFGPFKEKVSYPLNKRGLVLVRGKNKDGGSDSNGTGKSSLAMATLWALTGSVDPRPMSDAKVADIVNDSSLSARVSISGTLNEKKFVISRTKTSTKSALLFTLEGEELTTQSAKETQQIIDEKLGVDSQILARTMFHGQHAMNGLLEATDAKLKEELSLIVPTILWQNGAKLARSKALVASKKVAEFDGMMKLRDSDIAVTRQRLEAAAQNVAAKRSEYRERAICVGKLQEEAKSEAKGASLSDLHELVESAAIEIRSLENEIHNVEISRRQALSGIQGEIDEIGNSLATYRNELHKCSRQVDRALMSVELEERTLQQVSQKWNLDTSTEATIFAAPDVCPTCNQPLSEEGHLHTDLSDVVQAEVEGGLFAVEEAKASLEQCVYAKDQMNAKVIGLENKMEILVALLDSATEKWNCQMERLNFGLTKSRSDHTERTAELSKAAVKVHADSMEASLHADRRALEALESICEGLRADFDSAASTLANLRKQSEEQRVISVTMGGLTDIFGARGIQIFVLQNAVEALQAISQCYLDELSDSTQRLEISLDASDRILRRAFIRNPEGTFLERPMSSLSGGQWRRCSLALSLGFADLVARRGKMRSSLMVLDEPLTHLDRSGRSNVGSLLRKLLQKNEMIGDLATTGFAATTILIILQDLAAEELEESFDRIDEVVKEGGFSFVSVDEMTQ